MFRTVFELKRMRIIKSKPGFSRPLGHRCSKARSLPRRDCPVVCKTIALLHDPVTWYGINYAGMQITPWDFQNKGKSGWIGTSSFVLKVPLRYLRPSVIYSVSCDWILQSAYILIITSRYIGRLGGPYRENSERGSE